MWASAVSAIRLTEMAPDNAASLAIARLNVTLTISAPDVAPTSTVWPEIRPTLPLPDSTASGTGDEDTSALPIRAVVEFWMSLYETEPPIAAAPAETLIPPAIAMMRDASIAF